MGVRRGKDGIKEGEDWKNGRGRLVIKGKNGKSVEGRVDSN